MDRLDRWYLNDGYIMCFKGLDLNLFVVLDVLFVIRNVSYVGECLNLS